MTSQPNLELIVETWRKMSGDPANLSALLVGEMTDFIDQLTNLIVAENLNRHFSVALALDMAALGSDPTLPKVLDVAEKMLRVREVRTRLDEMMSDD